jgi:protein-S-isoprenylcysteine O-methyltransferase Ste14
MKKRLKINGFIMVCAGLAVVIFHGIFLRKYFSGLWENSLQVLGFAFIFLGQIIRVSARGYKAEHSDQSQALIQGGPYQVVRNPMYLGIILIGLGVVLTVFQWWAALIFAVVFIIRYILLIFEEENKLLTIFGQSYQDYCNKVARLLPSFVTLGKLKMKDYFPLRMHWFYKEIGSMIALILIILAALSWNIISSQGLIPYFKQLFWIFLMFFLFLGFAILLSKWYKGKNENVPNKS